VNAISREPEFDQEDEYDLNLDEELAVLQHYKQLMTQRGKC
jgi:hypothetical protein